MADHRHKRDTNARRFNPFRARAVVIAGPLAVLATASVVTLGVLGADPDLPDRLIADAAAGDLGEASDQAGDRARDLASDARSFESLSRSSDRTEARIAKSQPEAGADVVRLSRSDRLLQPQAVAEAVRQADTELWTTDVLNLWSEPGEEAAQTGELDAGEQVLVTGRTLFGREEIVLDGETRWVTAGYLSTEEPSTLGGDCTNGTSVPSGVSANIVAVHEAVCAQFPEITTYGTLRSDGEHAQGLAVDIMVSGDRGYQVAEFVREYYADLGVNYIIYSQEIWSVDRSGEGWRGMEDRGSTTANHYDHVHVTTY